MKRETKETYRIIEKLLIRLNQHSYTCQGKIYKECNQVEKKDEDARVAIMGFIRGEIIATFFHFQNIINFDNGGENQVENFKQRLGENNVPNKALLELLKSNIRMNFAHNIYSLLESGHRKFFKGGNFKKYKNSFDNTYVTGFEILRHMRNSMHSNGIYLPTDKKDFSCDYRGYKIEYKTGDFIRYNYKLIYWILRDSISLFTEMALDNISRNPSFIPIVQDYNINNQIRE